MKRNKILAFFGQKIKKPHFSRNLSNPAGGARPFRILGVLVQHMVGVPYAPVDNILRKVSPKLTPTYTYLQARFGRYLKIWKR